MNRNDRGFSLIELLVIIVIALSLLAWGYPNLVRLANKYRLDGAAWSLATDLQKVRLRAIAEGKEFKVVFDTGAKTYQVQKADGLGGWVNEGSSKMIEDARLLTVSIETGGAPVFTTRGIVQTGSQSTVKLDAPTGGTRRIFVQLQGRINVS